LEKKDRIIALIKEGCFFKGYNECNGKLVLHCKDGTFFFQISGWANSSIYSMSKEDFEATLNKDLVTLCKKHFNMVLKVQNEGKSWDEAIIYVMDKHIESAYDERKPRCRDKPNWA